MSLELKEWLQRGRFFIIIYFNLKMCLLIAVGLDSKLFIYELGKISSKFLHGDEEFLEANSNLFGSSVEDFWIAKT